MKALAKAAIVVAAFAALASVTYSYLRPTDAVPLTAGSSESCGRLSATDIVESESFTPYEAQRTKPFNGPIVALGERNTDIPSEARIRAESVDDRARQHNVVTDAGSVYAYFSTTDVTSVTRSDFMAGGGIELTQDVANPDDPFVDYLLDFLGERAVPVEVGPHKGAITWSDPDVNGVRTHNVYWSDGEFNYALLADQPAADVLNLARSLVC